MHQSQIQYLAYPNDIYILEFKGFRIKEHSYSGFKSHKMYF